MNEKKINIYYKAKQFAEIYYTSFLSMKTLKIGHVIFSSDTASSVHKS